MSQDVEIVYLELTKDDLISRRKPDIPVNIRYAEYAEGALHQFFYRWVGEPWQWLDKAGWSLEQWNAHAKKSQLWIIYRSDTPVGYFELAKEPASIELQYFGLAPEGIGLGIGGYALEYACHQALKLGDRVTVNTCSLDHPAALANYKKSGFKELRREIEQS